MKDKVTFNFLWYESINFFKKNFMMLTLLGLLFYLAPMVFVEYNGLLETYNGMPAKDMIPVLISLASLSLLSTILGASIIYSMKSKKGSFGEVINGASKYYLRAIGLSIVLSIFLILILLVVFIPLAFLAGPSVLSNRTTLGLLVVIAFIPMLFFAIRWIFSTFVLIFDDSKILSSLGKSKKIVEGRWWNVFFMLLLFFLVLIIIIFVLQIVLTYLLNYIGIPLLILFFTNLIPMFVSIFSLIFIGNYYLALRK